MSIGVGLLDARGQVLHANPAAREMLGLTDEDIRNPVFWQTNMVGLQEDGTPFPPDQRPVLKAIRAGNGSCWALVNVDPQRDEDGAVRNVIVWFSDVTEQRRADEQLRLLAQAVQSTSEMITITDREGRFTFANRAFLERTGSSEREILGQTVELRSSTA